MPTKIQGGLGIDKVQDGTVGMSDVDTELYGKITALTTINLGEAKTASGTFVDFVGIPEGVKRITVMFDGVSTTGSSGILIQIGGVGGVETTGYLGTGFSAAGAAIGVSPNSTTGLLLPAINAAVGFNGMATINVSTGNVWVFNGKIASSGDARIAIGAGSKTISGALDRIRITTVNGTDQFDAGTINISWEF